MADLPIFRFANGRTVQIRQVSHLLEQQVRRSLPQPQPPLNAVDYSDGRGEVREPNYSDPDYIQAVHAHNAEVRERVLRLFLLRGTVFDVDQAAVDELRAEMASLGVTLPDDNRYVYLYFLCTGSEEETTRLVEAIRGESQPTEEAVAEAARSFRGNVERPAD